jgi:hypothetical protein
VDIIYSDLGVKCFLEPLNAHCRVTSEALVDGLSRYVLMLSMQSECSVSLDIVQWNLRNSEANVYDEEKEERKRRMIMIILISQSENERPYSDQYVARGTNMKA